MNYYYQAKTPIGASQEYGVRALELARRKAGNDLYSILYSQRLPAVVDIDESSTDGRDLYSPELENITTITLSVTPVTHKHITMTHADYEREKEIAVWGLLRAFWYKIIRRK